MANSKVPTQYRIMHYQNLLNGIDNVFTADFIDELVFYAKQGSCDNPRIIKDARKRLDRFYINSQMYTDMLEEVLAKLEADRIKLSRGKKKRVGKKK